MTLVLAAVLPPLVMAGLSTTVSVLTRESFLECLPFSLICSSLVMIVSQLLFKTFLIGTALVVVFAAMSIPLFIYGGTRERVLKAVRSYGMILFCIITLVVLYFDIFRSYTTWDEFSHWGPMVKEMIRLDRFYSVPESTLMVHKDYPPFVAALELLWCFLGARGYSEASVSAAIHILVLTFACSTLYANIGEECETLNKKMATAICACLTALFLMVSMNVGGYFKTIYLDCLIPAIWTYSMWLVFSDQVHQSAFSFCLFVLAQVALILTKQVGIAFVCLSVLAYALKSLFSETRNHDGVLLPLVRIAFVFAAVFAANTLWSGYVRALGISGQFDLSQLSIEKLKSILAGDPTAAFQRGVIKSFIAALFYTNIGSGALLFSYASVFVLLLSGLNALMLISSNHRAKEDLGITTLVFVVGTMGYAAMMGVLYVFCFEPFEQEILASFERYMSSYVLGELLIVLSVLDTSLQFHMTDKVKLAGVATALCVACCAALAPTSLVRVLPDMGNVGAPYAKHADVIKRSVKPGERVYLATKEQGFASGTGYEFCIPYYADGIVFPRTYGNVMDGRLDDPQEREEVLQTIASCDYLYVIEPDDNFNQVFGDMIGGEAFTDGGLYRVKLNGQEVALEPIV